MKTASIAKPSGIFNIQYNSKPSYVVSFFAYSLSILETVRMVGFIRYEPNYFLLVGLMMLSVFTSFSSSTSKVKFSYILFFFYLCFNIVITSPPIIFNPWGRLILFFIVISCVSPMFDNKPLIQFREKCLFSLIKLAVVLSALSCICYFLGINYFVNHFGITDYTSKAGLFGGLFTHSMLLGPMAGISSCYLIWIYLRTKRKKYLVLCILTLGSVFFSASRAALISTSVACAILIFVYYKKKTTAVKKLLILTGIIAVTSPFWSFSLNGINEKNLKDERMGKYGSRTEKFDARMEEFESAPIIGIGFASISLKGSDDFNIANGQIEPGSSWLCTLSMTGIIGLLFVAYFMIEALKSSKHSRAPSASLMFSLTVWFVVHMFFEGYIYSAGGPLCFIYWLTVGVSSDQKFIE